MPQKEIHCKVNLFTISMKRKSCSTANAAVHHKLDVTWHLTNEKFIVRRLQSMHPISLQISWGKLCLVVWLFLDNTIGRKTQAMYTAVLQRTMLCFTFQIDDVIMESNFRNWISKEIDFTKNKSHSKWLWSSLNWCAIPSNNKEMPSINSENCRQHLIASLRKMRMRIQLNTILMQCAIFAVCGHKLWSNIASEFSIQIRMQ